ncbi:uncharacterized protein LOC113308924 isoform X1 [Papaver somniferum]|uniref:uncharacterized protein LOC113308924 isoform X1 n=1 Tax=Papaver somniferum TaxID=3469 RepID=UPI000E6F6D93|nr:uncharacterized protein LOC113308924 isoform X1 [Papaver somniferum]XP_026413160.1 uncharacterized protein LOC113308924 isoform X1 [Papaver somniferum]
MDMDIDDKPLDFETEDSLLMPSISTAVSSKRRNKVIGLDDLLCDYYAEQGNEVQQKAKMAKKAKPKKRYNSDDEDTIMRNKEARLIRTLEGHVANSEKEVSGIKAEFEIPYWGVSVFGDQKATPSLVAPELGSCQLVQSFTRNELNSIVKLNAEKGETFLQGLLINGWLLKLVLKCGHVQESIATWCFNLMLYSPKEKLSESACTFWCSILQANAEESPQIDWLPTYAEIKKALVTYGYLPDSSNDPSSVLDKDGKDHSGGPPQNIRCWVRFLAACSEARSKWSIISDSDAENCLCVIIHFYLDRQLEGLSLLFYECTVSVINFFTDNEWNISRVKVAKSLACRANKDLNCLRLVECISGVDARSKHLRSELAFQMLLKSIDEKVSDGEDILRFLISINVKDRNCDFFPMFIYLVLAENWLLFGPPLEDKPYIPQMLGVYLRNCSSQISSTDMRCYASKVRNKASYLLQSTFSRRN